MVESKIRDAIIQALKSIPELAGCLPSEIIITGGTPPDYELGWHIVFDVPFPILYGGS